MASCPATYVVGCPPADVGEGIGLSEQVEAAVPEAIETIAALLRERIPGLSISEQEVG